MGKASNEIWSLIKVINNVANVIANSINVVNSVINVVSRKSMTVEAVCHAKYWEFSWDIVINVMQNVIKWHRNGTNDTIHDLSYIINNIKDMEQLCHKPGGLLVTETLLLMLVLGIHVYHHDVYTYI